MPPTPATRSPAASARPTTPQREAIADADTPRGLLDPAGDVDLQSVPTVHRLEAGLAEDRWQAEFKAGLEQMLDRIEILLDTR
jgi:hypothetical protein